MKIVHMVLLFAAVSAAALTPFFAAQAAAQDAPRVTGVAVTSGAGADATYALGETIRVTVRFSEAVAVSGSPGLNIDMDPAEWGTKRAAYESGSGTTKLVFAHEVVEPNLSMRGVAVLADSLALNGGAIRSAATGAAAALAHGGLAHDPAHKVDWRLAPRDTTPPRLVRGEVDGGTMRLFFSEALDPRFTGGRFLVDVAHETPHAGFYAAGAVSVSGNVVTVGLGAGNPRAQAGRLEGNLVGYLRRADGGGGALRDLAGNPVAAPHVLPLAGGETWRGAEEWRFVKTRLANLTGPAVTGVALVSDAGADATYAQGETVRAAVTFSEAVTVTGAPRLKLDLGGGAGGERWATYRGGSGTAALAFAYTVARGDASSAGVAVLANTLELNGGGIRAAAREKNADLAHGGLGHDANHRVDGTPDTRPPRLSAARVNGATLTLSFDEALGAAASPSRGAFTVRKRTPARAGRTATRAGTGRNLALAVVGAVAVSGSTVTLTLAEAVGGADTGVTVSYARSASGTGNRLRDEAGNEVAGFADEPVTNVAGDTTPPRLVRGEIDGGTMTLFFSEAMDPDSVGGRFPMTVMHSNGLRYSFIAEGEIEVRGNAVTVGLGSPFGWPAWARAGYRHNVAAYCRPANPAAKQLRDLAGNPMMVEAVTGSTCKTIFLDNITGSSVTGVAVVSDAGEDATYGPGEKIRVRLSFREAVAVTGTPRLRLDFSAGTGDERWAAYESGSGTTALEFAYTVAQGDASDAGARVLADTLELNGGTIRSVARSEDAALLHTGLDRDSAHKVDARQPTLSAASVNGATLKLIFDETLGAAGSLANGAFTVKKTPQGGSEQTAGLSGSPVIGGKTVTLTLADATLETDTDVKVSYARPTSGTGNRLVDAAGNEVAGFSDEAVTKISGDTTPPVLVRGEIDGGTVILYFSEALDPDSVGGRFRVRLGFPKCDGPGWSCVLSSDVTGQVQIRGNTVTVEVGMSGTRARAQNFHAEYHRPTDSTARGLRDLAGNEVRSSTRAISLSNLTGVALSVTGVSVVSGAGADATYGLGDTIRVRLTFSKTVTVTGTPRLKLDLGPGTGDERWAVYESGSGTTMLVFAWTVAQGDASDAGVAVLANTLELNGGAIRGMVKGRDADLAHGGLVHDLSHKVDGALADTTPPALSGAAVDGTTLTLAFDEPLGAAASLANGAFPVKKTPQGGGEQSVGLTGTPAVSGASVALTLANAVLETDTDEKVS